jgi:hypothetical protein
MWNTLDNAIAIPVNVMFYACVYVGMFVMLVGNNIFIEWLEEVKTSTDICRM